MILISPTECPQEELRTTIRSLLFANLFPDLLKKLLWIVAVKSQALTRLLWAWALSDFSMDNVRIHDHLTPNLQQLLSETNKLTTSHQFQFVWVKNMDIMARKTSTSQVYKLKCMADRNTLKRTMEGQSN